MIDRAWSSSGDDIEPMDEAASDLAAERAAQQAAAFLAAVWHSHAACREAGKLWSDKRAIKARLKAAIAAATRAAVLNGGPRP